MTNIDMSHQRIDSENDITPWIKRKTGLLFHVQPTPRITLFFIAIPIKFIASALSYGGYYLNSPILLISGLIAWLVWFAILFLIAVPVMDQFLRNQMRWLKPTAVIIFIIFLLAGPLEVAGLSAIRLGAFQDDQLDEKTSELLTTIDRAFVHNDSTALVHQATENLLDGNNPYAEANIISAMNKLNDSYDKVTPLREGRFAEAFPYPEMDEIEQSWQEAVKNPEHVPPEFETKLNYPAGLLLLSAPFFLLGLDNFSVINLLFALPALAYVVVKARRSLAIFLVAALLISLEIWNMLASGAIGFLPFPFLLLAWLLPRKHLWLSALFMGVAVAIKQTAWFFLPFYLIFIFRTVGWRRLLPVLGIIAGVFLATNAPFIISDPELWITSILAPVTDSLFPWGVGVVSLVAGGVFEIQSPLIFSVLGICVAVLAIFWYFRYCPRYPYTGLVLGVLPLFFAWRSLWAYFFYIDIIILSGVIINEYGAKASEQPATALVPSSTRNSE